MFARKLTNEELTTSSTIRGGKANSTSSMPYDRAELIEPGSEPHNTRTLGPITTQGFTRAEAAAALELSRTAPTDRRSQASTENGRRDLDARLAKLGIKPTRELRRFRPF